ncbi:MAG: hypothetical protein O3A00_28555 [Planctomycetota bacterium]|nr:hypothetical protein [Planctomycetota bacterium]
MGSSYFRTQFVALIMTIATSSPVVGEPGGDETVRLTASRDPRHYVRLGPHRIFYRLMGADAPAIEFGGGATLFREEERADKRLINKVQYQQLVRGNVIPLIGNLYRVESIDEVNQKLKGLTLRRTEVVEKEHKSPAKTARVPVKSMVSFYGIKDSKGPIWFRVEEIQRRQDHWVLVVSGYWDYRKGDNNYTSKVTAWGLKVGDRIEVAQLSLRILKIVHPDKDTGITGWVEFSADEIASHSAQ